MADWAEVSDLVLRISWLGEGKATIFLRKHSAKKFLLAPLRIRGVGPTVVVNTIPITWSHPDFHLYISFECLEQNEEIGTKVESFAKDIQGPKETFTDFLQRLTSAVNRMIPNSKARQIIIESLDFEIANSQCKRIIGY